MAKHYKNIGILLRDKFIQFKILNLFFGGDFSLKTMLIYDNMDDEERPSRNFDAFSGSTE